VGTSTTVHPTDNQITVVNPFGLSIWGIQGPTGQRGDYDCDGDVDRADWLRFLVAYCGPFSPTPDPGAELTGDTDVDLEDFTVFSANYTGPQNLGSVNTCPLPPLGTVWLDLVPVSPVPAVVSPGGMVNYEIWARDSLENNGLYAVAFDVLTDTACPQDPAGMQPPAEGYQVEGGVSIDDDLGGAWAAPPMPGGTPTPGLGQGQPLQLAFAEASTIRLPERIGRYYVRTAAGGADVLGGTCGYSPAELVHSSGFPIDVVIDCDFDNDLDVDLSDFAVFQGCFNGPNRQPAEGCTGDADFDNDNDVDLSDFGGLGFQVCFNGPNRPAVRGWYCTTTL
jgi:hypothetical protein